jgi:Flp pilus assembly pilin Flp
VIRYAIERLRSLVKDERGQDLIEYAMLGGLIALAIAAVATLGVLSGAIESMADGIGACIDFDSLTDCAPF